MDIDSNKVISNMDIDLNKVISNMDVDSNKIISNTDIDLIKVISNKDSDSNKNINSNKVILNMDIEYLRQFFKLSYEEKVKVIKNGRPTPELKDLRKSKGTNVVRKFKTTWYVRKDWLCGCESNNKLFCFPCLLFAVGSDSVWVTTGYCDLNNLTTALLKHERSAAHYDSVIAWKTYGTPKTGLNAEKQKKKSNVEDHNKKVKANREILNKLISATCFLIKQELSFRGNNESKSSSNRGNYIELLNYTAKLDDKLAHHLQSSTVFSGLSNRIQNELIESIGIAVENNIKDEILRAQFVAIEVDEMTDVSNKLQCSTVLRYVLDSEVKEAFVGFDELEDKSVTCITDCIFRKLDKYTCVEKLVAQTYDGATVMSSHLDEVQAKIKEKAPSALFTHCYAHNLNFVLSQSAKFISECSLFFKTTESLASFFSQSTTRTDFLDKIVRERIPNSAPITWSFDSNLVQNIFHHHSDLCKLFLEIINHDLPWDSDTVVMSEAFYIWLNEKSTYFLLTVYEEIFLKTEVLSDVLQTSIIDIPLCIEKINETMNSLNVLSQYFYEIYEKFEESCFENNITESNSKQNIPLKEERERIFSIILNDVIKIIKTRYYDFKNLLFISLFDSKTFSKKNGEADRNGLEALAKNYGNYFDIIRLKSDLIGIYSSQLFCDISFKDSLAFINKNGLRETFPEAVKLLELILTIPATPVSVERSSFSALKRIKTFTRNRMKSERLSSLALLAIEKERLIEMEENPLKNLNEAVTNIFVGKKEKRRMSFSFK